MKRLFALVFVAALAAAGCNESTSTPNADKAGKGENVRAALDQLSPEDRALAEEQKLCPITKQPLGSMGVPRKVMVKGQPVFLCCDGCDEKALADPDATLKKVEELKAKNKSDK